MKLEVKLGELVEEIEFTIMRLGIYCDLVLGIPWLRKSNAEISWRHGEIKLWKSGKEYFVKQEKEDNFSGIASVQEASAKTAKRWDWVVVASLEIRDNTNDEGCMEEEIQKLISNFPAVFKEQATYPISREIKHHIELKENKVIYRPPY